MRWLLVTVVAVVLLAALPSSLSAQTASTVTAVTIGPARPQAGDEVKVTEKGGPAHKGKLVSLSNTEVVFNVYGRETTLQLWEVRQIEMVPHGVRNGAILGAVTMGLFGTVAASGMSDCRPDCGLASLMVAGFLTGLGAGIGAGIGGLSNNFPADRYLVYRSKSSAVVLAPVLSPKVVGLQLGMRW